MLYSKKRLKLFWVAFEGEVNMPTFSGRNFERLLASIEGCSTWLIGGIFKKANAHLQFDVWAKYNPRGKKWRVCSIPKVPQPKKRPFLSNSGCFMTFGAKAQRISAKNAIWLHNSPDQTQNWKLTLAFLKIPFLRGFWGNIRKWSIFRRQIWKIRGKMLPPKMLELQLDLSGIAEWAYAGIFAVAGRFQNQDQFWISHQNILRGCFFVFSKS